MNVAALVVLSLGGALLFVLMVTRTDPLVSVGALTLWGGLMDKALGDEA